MIDPKNITNYNLNNWELEEHILFWICAAGKSAITAAKSLDKLLWLIAGYDIGPFNAIMTHAELYFYEVFYVPFAQVLKECGIGCYNHKAETMVEIASSGLNLKTCTVDDLEKIKGIGRKTSRCFILHTREDVECAGLDTHMLKYLKTEGVENVPKSTPGSKKEYDRLEKEFIIRAKKANKTVAEFDLEIWNKYAIIPKED